MSVQYQKIYAKNNFVAYGRADGVVDHLFIWESSSGPSSFSSLAEMLRVWTAGRRTLLFCPEFDPTTVVGALDSLAASPGLPSLYGKFWYWTEPIFTGRAPADNVF